MDLVPSLALRVLGVDLDVGDPELEVGQGPVLEGRLPGPVERFAALLEEELRVAGVVGRVEVGEEHDHDVAGQTDEDVPDAVQERDPEVPPDVAECLGRTTTSCSGSKLTNIFTISTCLIT